MRNVPISEWGRDHWSLLGYIECVCVDRKGVLDPARMRCNPDRHPGLALPQHARSKGNSYPYPTRLRGDKTEPEHDDHDCFEDIEAEGLADHIGTGIHPVARLTPKGREIANQLRAHKAAGGTCSNFFETLP